MQKSGVRRMDGLVGNLAGYPFASSRQSAPCSTHPIKMKTPSIIVIGAGIGGISAAARLAQRGLRVTVLEKNSRPGGRCDRISRDGHHFDTGPTLLVMPRLYEAEFAALGTSMQ